MENKDVYKWKESTEFNQTLINQSMIELSKKRANRTKFIRKVQLCSILLVPLLTFTILVNTSQQFVSAMNDVPFINKIVDIFKYNPSIYLARNTEIYQKIDKIYKTDEYTLYIESMVVDEDQIVLYYQVNSEKDIQSAFFTPNDYWPCGVSAANFEVNQLSFESIDPDEIISLDEFNFTFEASDTKGNLIGEPLNITIQNDLSKVQKAKVIELNKEVIIQGQKLTVDKLEVYPLRTLVYTTEDINNSMDILQVFYSLKTKVGQEVGRITNGTSGMYVDEDTYVYILESPYAMDDEFELYIDDIRWVEKDEQNLVYDLSTKSFDYLPEYIQLQEADDHDMTLRVSGNYKNTYGGLNGMVVFGKNWELIVEDDYVSFCLLIYYDDLEFKNNKTIISNDIGYMSEVNQSIGEFSY